MGTQISPRRAAALATYPGRTARPVGTWAVNLGGRWLWFVLSLIGVVLFACDTKYVTHQVWGAFAVVAYGLAALAAVVLPRRWVAESATAISVVGAVLAPLAVLTMSGRGQSEVGVV
jgi:hypothetical protein